MSTTHIESGVDTIVLRRRDSKWLALVEFAAVLLIFLADWWHYIPLSKTPFLFALAWPSLRWRHLSWRDVGLTAYRPWTKALAYGLAGGVALELLELFVTQPIVVHLTGQRPDLEDFRVLTGNTTMLAVALVLAWVLAAFGEETVYRGYLMNRVAGLGNYTRWAWTVSLLAVSALFAIAHTYQGIAGVLEVVVAGLFLGLLYLGCGRNLWVPILAHGIQDTIDVLLIYLDRYPGM